MSGELLRGMKKIQPSLLSVLAVAMAIMAKILPAVSQRYTSLSLDTLREALGRLPRIGEYFLDAHRKTAIDGGSMPCSPP